MGKRRRRRPSERKPQAERVAGPTLDLHGRLATEARREAERWLRARAAVGDSMVTLITGRGLHSQGGAVLPGEIEHLLTRLRGEGLVEDFIPISLGGAFRVHLAHLPTPRTRRPQVEAVPLTLRRRAEEALIDLGIDPTPETIAAEVRRMLREGEADEGPTP